VVPPVSRIQKTRTPDEIDLTAAEDDAIAVAGDYDDRAAWLEAHDLDLSDTLIDGWAGAHRAAVVLDGTVRRTLYRSRRWSTLPLGVLR
jgi:hypothetical protein